MKLVNKTGWRTDHLKAIANRVALDELDPARRKRMTIEISTARGSACSGYAYLRSGWCLIRVHAATVDRRDLAATIAHEFAHCRGLKHPDMKNARYGWREGWRDLYAYADDFPLERKAPKTKVAVDLIATRAEHARAMLSKWDRKLKTTKTIWKRWRDKVRYYERKAAARRPAAEGGSHEDA